MQKGKKSLLLFLLVILIPFSMTMVGCNKVTDIKLVSASQTYNVGDELKLSDFTIVLTYKDKSTKEVAVTQDMLNENLPELTTEGTYEISVTYENKVYKVTITVTDPNKVSDITIIDYQKNYETFDTFTANGKIKIVYLLEDKDDEIIEITDDMIVDMPDMTTAGEKTIQVKYNDEILEYTINVTERKVFSYEFIGVRKDYYTTMSVNDITIEGGILLIVYTNQTIKEVQLENGMIETFPSDFNGEEGEYKVIIKIDNIEFELLINVTIDPEAEEYNKLVDSIKDLISNSLSKGTNIQASAGLYLNAKAVGNTTDVKKKVNGELKLGDISDLYLAAVTEDVIKAILDVSSEKKFGEIIKNPGSLEFNLDLIEIIKTALDRFVNTTTDFDFYNYVNSNEVLIEFKNEVVEFIAEMLNGITFSFDKYGYDYDEFGYYINTGKTEEFAELEIIVEQTIIRPLLMKNCIGQEFLDAYKSYAESFSELYPKLSEASMDIVNFIIKNPNPKHTLSTFIRLVNTVIIEKYDEMYDGMVHEDSEIVLGYADIVEYFEDYFFQNPENDEIITLDETSMKFLNRVSEMIEYCESNDMEVNEFLVITNYVALIMTDSRNIAPVSVTLTFDALLANLSSELDDCTWRIENNGYILDSYENLMEYTKSELEWVESIMEDPEIREYWEDYYQYLLAQLEETQMMLIILNDECMYYSQRIDEICYTIEILTQLQPVVTEYAYNVAFGLEVDYADIGITVANIFGQPELAEIIKSYADEYAQTGVAHVLSDLISMVKEQFSESISSFIGEEETERIFNCMYQIALRLDEHNNYEDSTLTTDIISILVESYSLELTKETVKEQLIEIGMEISYYYVTTYKDTLVEFIVMAISQTTELDDTQLQNLLILIDDFVTDSINYIYNNGEEVDLVNFVYSLADELGLEYVVYFIKNYIDYNTFYFAKALVAYVQETIMPRVQEDYIDVYSSIFESLNKLADAVDTYFLKEQDVANNDLITASDELMIKLKALAVDFDGIDLYILCEVYDIATSDMTNEEIVVEVEKIVYTLELLTLLDEKISIQNYVDIKNVVSTLIDAYYTKTLSTKLIVNTIIESKIVLNKVVNLVCLSLNLNEDATIEFTNMVNEIIDDYLAGNCNTQQLAQKYFDFVNNYGGENTPLLYGIGVAILVYTEQEVDYNELFKNVQLPATMPAVDYNQLIKSMITKESIENAISFSGVKEVINYNPDDNSIISQSVIIEITIDFATPYDFIVLQGSLYVNLSVNY